MKNTIKFLNENETYNRIIIDKAYGQFRITFYEDDDPIDSLYEDTLEKLIEIMD